MLIYYVLFFFNIITVPINKYSSRIYWYLNALFVWFVMAFKSFTVGSDTNAYVSLYRSISTTVIPSNFINWFFPANGARFENGYLVFNKLLASIDSNPQFLFIVSASIFIICLTFMVQKLHLNTIVGFLTFECLGFFTFFMSGLRQGLACSFCMVAFVFAVKKDPIKFLLFYYLALSMHVSAIVFAVVYLINFMRNDFKSNTLFIVAAVIFFLLFDDIFAWVAANSEEMSNFTLSAENNGGTLNVCLSVLMILSALLVVRFVKLPETNLKIYTISKYMLYGAIVFYLISLKSTQISRVAMYFEIGYFPVLSYLFEYSNKQFKVISQVIIVFALIAYASIIFVYRPEWTGVVPYSFCF